MPRRRNVDLALKVLDYVKSRGCVLTGDVAAALGISDDRAYHILQALAARGELCIIRGAVFNIWCARGAEVDPFTAAVPCLDKIRDVLRRAAESARGRVVSIAPRRIAKALAEECRRPVRPFLLTAAVYSYLEYLLGVKIKRGYIMSREALLDLSSKTPVARPPCVSLRQPAASRSYMATVTFKLPRGVLAELDRLASQLGKRRSDLIRRVLMEYIRNVAVAPPAAQEADLEETEDFPVIRGR